MSGENDPAKPLFTAPTPAELNRRYREFWADVGARIDKRMSNLEEVKLAIDSIKEEMLKGVPAPFQSSFEQKMLEYESLEKAKQSKTARKKRPNAASPFTAFFVTKLKRNISASEIVDALIDDARTGTSGDFRLSDDGTFVESALKEGVRLKISGLSSAVAKARTKIREK